MRSSPTKYHHSGDSVYDGDYGDELDRMKYVNKYKHRCECLILKVLGVKI